MKISKSLLPIIAGALLLATAACVAPTWLSEAESIVKVALPIAVGLADVVDPAAAPLVNRIADGLGVVDDQLGAYAANPTASALTQIQNQLAQLNADLAQAETAANIANPNTKTEVQSALADLAQAFQEIAAQIPQASATAAQAGLPGQAGTTGAADPPDSAASSKAPRTFGAARPHLSQSAKQLKAKHSVLYAAGKKKIKNDPALKAKYAKALK